MGSKGELKMTVAYYYLPAAGWCTRRRTRPIGAWSRT
jgi:hypothetical protein